MALKIVLPVLLLLVCWCSEAQGQGDGTSLPVFYRVMYDSDIVTNDSAICPADEIREDIRDQVSSDIQGLLQNTVFPSLLLSQGWTRIAYLDMTDPTQQCPNGWELYDSPRRSCGRTAVGATNCESQIYQNNGRSYDRVCGRIIAYQLCAPEAFRPYNFNPTRTIDNVYVDGVSITHGSPPREHVWTFAAARAESYLGGNQITCPCTNTNNPNNDGIGIPPFIGNDYFCDSGTFGQPDSNCSMPETFYDDDPLWDGAGCSSTSTCCEFNNPPWFCKTLPEPTTDDIEVRLCGTQVSTTEDTPIELIEIYVY